VSCYNSRFAFDRKSTHLALAHQTVCRKCPVLQAIYNEQNPSIELSEVLKHGLASSSPPAYDFVVVLIPKLDGDLVIRERKELFAELISRLLFPLACQEGDDLIMALEELVAIAPDGVCVGLGESGN
jgi:hypothetical protein